MGSTMAMYTTISPSVTITPVYSSTKEKQKYPFRAPVSSVSVQVEPVDLSTRPAEDGTGLCVFLNTVATHSPPWKGEGEKEEKTREWSRSKKIHRCSYPGCEKVRFRELRQS